MTIVHRITDKPTHIESDSTSPQGDIASQLSGMIGQASGLAGAGVGLPGLNSLGSSISSLASSITGSGAGIGGAIANLGTSMASGTMAGMSALVTSMTSQLSSLTSLLNPGGALAQILHSHTLDKDKGIKASAFQGQHTTTWDNDGVTHSSSSKVTSTAPKIPHNGLTMVSDALQVTKGITGQSFGMLSDARLKTNVDDLPSVLDKVMSLKLKTFNVRTVDWERNEVHPSEPRRSMGLIAQDVEKIFPDLVHGDKFLSLEENKIGLYVLAAFQEFVVEVRNEISDLKKS